MCYGCYKEQVEQHGPLPITDQVRAASKLIGDVYRVHLAGGAAHIVVDDWNLGDEEIDWCLRGMPDDVCRACLDAMRGLTAPERAAALALHDGFLADAGG